MAESISSVATAKLCFRWLLADYATNETIAKHKDEHPAHLCWQAMCLIR
jgi:hypothetical protein